MQSSQLCLWNSRWMHHNSQKNSRTSATSSASHQQMHYCHQPSTTTRFRSRRMANHHLVQSMHSRKSNSRLWTSISKNTSPSNSSGHQHHQQAHQYSLSRNPMEHFASVSTTVALTRLPSRTGILYL